MAGSGVVSLLPNAADLQVVEADVGAVDVEDGPFGLAFAELLQACADVTDVAEALQRRQRSAERAWMNDVVGVQEVEVLAFRSKGR